MELAPHRNLVNSLSPGDMMMDMMRGLQVEQSELVRQFEKETMFRRIGYPQKVEYGMLLLCNDAGRWYAGQHMLIDGGASSWKHSASFEDNDQGNQPFY